MAYYHAVVSGGIELSPGLVGDGDIADCNAGFECDAGNGGDALFGDEVEEGVGGLGGDAFWGRLGVSGLSVN